MPINLNDIFKFTKSQIHTYKLHLAALSEEGIHPYDAYIRDWSEWHSWQEYSNGTNDWSRDFIFSVIPIKNQPDRWVFGGIFKVLSRNNESFSVELVDYQKDLIGKLILDFHRYQGLRGRDFNLETLIDSFIVKELRLLPLGNPPH